MSSRVEAALAHWEGEPVRVWEELWSVPRLEALSSVDSTNVRARQLADDGAPVWTVVVTEEQTAGKGREGRSWRSESGQGLWFSLIGPRLRTSPGLLPLRVGSAVVAVLRTLGGGNAISLKWPNDVWWRDRKLGGILCERDATATVIGVGLNLQAPRTGDFTVPPVGLHEIVQGRLARGPLLGALVARIRSTVESGGARLSAAELERLEHFDCLRARAVRCDPGPGGIARGVGADGGLRIETGKGIRTVHAGTVRPIGPAPRHSAPEADEGVR